MFKREKLSYVIKIVHREYNDKVSLYYSGIKFLKDPNN